MILIANDIISHVRKTDIFDIYFGKGGAIYIRIKTGDNNVEYIEILYGENMDKGQDIFDSIIAGLISPEGLVDLRKIDKKYNDMGFNEIEMYRKEDKDV